MLRFKQKDFFSLSLSLFTIITMVGCSNNSKSDPAVEVASGLSIESVVYDDNNTETIADDTVYVYFDQTIDEDLIENTVKDILDINDTVDYGTIISAEYNDTKSHLLKISLGEGAEDLIPDSTKDSLLSDIEKEIDSILTTDDNPVSVTLPRVILKTGQTISYVANDDGDSQNGVARSYTDLNGTVTDNATKLMWQQVDDATLRDYNGSIAYCEDLNLSGFTDWRVPTINELVQLTDKGVDSPSIDAVFTDTKSSEYWSSTVFISDALRAWNVNFAYAESNDEPKTETYYTRCVR